MSAHHVTFHGVNESGFVTAFGYVFPSGESVEVDDAKLGEVNLRRLKNHPEFTVRAVSAPKAEPAKAEPEAAPKPPRAVKRRASRKVK